MSYSEIRSEALPNSSPAISNTEVNIICAGYLPIAPGVAMGYRRSVFESHLELESSEVGCCTKGSS